MSLVVQIKDNKIFAHLLNKWLVDKPEEKVRQEYICRLVNNYGFSLDQMQQEIKVSNSQRGQGRAMADIVIWRDRKDRLESNSPIIVVECKAEHITVREEDYFQGYNYASWAGADFFVTTNLKETRIFRVLKGKIPKKLEEIIDIPSADIVKNDKKVNALLSQTKSFTREEFSRLLFKCHNIIRNNDKLSPEAAFDEISKILFMKIRYERNPDEDNIFSLKQFKKQELKYERTDRPINIKLHGEKADIPYMDYWFELTKSEFKDDDLFEDNERIRIRQNSFEAIVEELQVYNLSTTSDDIKGIAFEQFLGKTFRGELGQFFTPRTVVDFMVKVLDPEEGEVICDPCCGSGGFLIKAFEFVRSKIEQEIHQEKDQIKRTFYNEAYQNMSESEKEAIDNQVNDLFSKLNEELDINNEKGRLRVLSYDCIFGTDANPRMSRTAKMNMIMHGDGHGGVHHNDGLLNINGIFEGRFDIILTNPPFGARVEKSLKITEADKYTNEIRIAKYKERYDTEANPAYTNALKQVNDNIGKPLLSLFETGSMSSLTEVLFIERSLRLLKPGGRMGIVLPDGVLNNVNLQKIRDYVEGTAKIILITSIPQDVFIASGASVKPSLLFFKKFDDSEMSTYQKIKQDSEIAIKKKYKNQLENLSLSGKKLSKDEKKSIIMQQKQLSLIIEAEVKAKIKHHFDYSIPIAEVEKAGISSTGAIIDNQLDPLEKEYSAYRKANKLWNDYKDEVKYIIVDQNIYRMVSGEPYQFYGEK